MTEPEKEVPEEEIVESINDEDEDEDVDVEEVEDVIKN